MLEPQEESKRWTIFVEISIRDTYLLIQSDKMSTEFLIHCKKINSLNLDESFIENTHVLSHSDLFKKQALEFFSKTLPILKADDTLPKVAKYEDDHISYDQKLFGSKPGR